MPGSPPGRVFTFVNAQYCPLQYSYIVTTEANGLVLHGDKMRQTIRQSMIQPSMRKLTRQSITPSLVGIALLLSAPLSLAQSPLDWSVTISSGMPPPPVVRYEPVPVARPGHVWVQGYWNWHGGGYVWMPGHWVVARTGYVYVQPAWREGPRGWDLRRGGWHRGGHGYDHGYPGRGPGHCPPGHRKKGEC